MIATQAPEKQLELVKEVKISDLFRGRLDPRLEASGMLAKDGVFYVILDNLPHIALIGAELSATAEANQFIEQHQGHRRGFEDIAYDPRSNRFYVLIESLRCGQGSTWRWCRSTTRACVTSGARGWTSRLTGPTRGWKA